jgi:hypothetical protein
MLQHQKKKQNTEIKTKETDLLQKDIQQWPLVQLMMMNASTFYGCLY